MAYVSFSTKLRNLLLKNGTLVGGFAEILADCSCYVYSGSAPADADAAPTGTLLGIVTKSAGALTRAVAATNILTSNNTNVSNADTVTVHGKVYTFKTALTPTEGEVLIGADADGSLTNFRKAINATGTNGTDYQVAEANPNVSCGAVTAHAVTLTALRKGAAGNFIGLAKSAATLSITGALFTGGVDAANGLNWDDPADALMAKAAAETWQMVGVAEGIAGWMRICANASDSLAADTGPTYPRVDLDIANAGASVLMANTTIEIGAPSTVDALTITFPD